ncbi:hypothetical protein L1987_04043 [Smallanthus sonchifolius]|uniref:Uncharacterized protein n=1 Tax=Smallanthus sonchifolius TaxID=185202 RepID=A0ACB9KCC7_9ASTR|nr:hypothetical protein L1987_04043 [Smallanthus sonchifolius]
MSSHDNNKKGMRKTSRAAKTKNQSSNDKNLLQDGETSNSSTPTQTPIRRKRTRVRTSMLKDIYASLDAIDRLDNQSQDMTGEYDGMVITQPLAQPQAHRRPEMSPARFHSQPYQQPFMNTGSSSTGGTNDKGKQVVVDDTPDDIGFMGSNPKGAIRINENAASDNPDQHTKMLAFVESQRFHDLVQFLVQMSQSATQITTTIDNHHPSPSSPPATTIQDRGHATNPQQQRIRSGKRARRIPSRFKDYHM